MRPAAPFHRRAPTALLTALSLAAAGAARPMAPPAVAPEPAGRPADHVVIVSIDGLMPDYYLRANEMGLSLPNLQALRERGSWAEGVIGQYPSVTYPSHTSIVTGVRPARHGIVSNTLFEPEKGSTRWYYESSFIKVPTLWDLASAARLRTAALSWPATVGARIDELIPEVSARDGLSWLETIRKLSTPGLVEEVAAPLGGVAPDADRDYVQRDRFFGAAAAQVLRTRRPHLLLLHLVDTDHEQHERVPRSPEALAAFARADAHVGALVEAAAEAGIRDRTAWVITGDLAPATSRGQHGYLPEQPLMRTGLIVSGAGLRQGVVMPVARQVDIAPTVARLLGLEMKDVERAAMVGLLEPSAARTSR